MNWTEILPLDNQFFAGGAALGVLAFLWHTFRTLPAKVWPSLSRRILFSVTVDSAYTEAKLAMLGVWLARNGYSEKVGHVFYDQYAGNFSPGAMVLWVKYGGHRIFVRRSQENESTQSGTRTRTAITFTGMVSAKESILKLVNEIRETNSEDNEDKTLVATCEPHVETHCWIAMRDRSTIWLPTGAYESLLNDVLKFRSSPEKYRRLGVPYHRAWLLQGPPGTGKTTVVQALANDLSCGISVINCLEDFSLRVFLQTLNQAVAQNRIVLIEDVDATHQSAISAKADSNPNESQASPVAMDGPRMSLADMLNALDGISTPHGLQLFMTTNYPERISERLLRPGRVDKVVDFGYLDPLVADRMVQHFCPGEEQLAIDMASLVAKEETTPADLQSRLIAHAPI